MPGRSDCFGCIGTTFAAKRWLSLDACGLACVTCSFSVHLYALAVVSWMLVRGSWWNQVVYLALYVPCTLLATASLWKAWTTNPGAVPMGAKPLTTFKRQGSVGSTDNHNNAPKRALRRCHKCMDNFKPARAHHDSVTGRCIVKMDHYCPWIGNAVGALNHKFFVLFIGYTMTSCIAALIMLLSRFIHCSSYVAASSDDAEPSQQDAGESIAEGSRRFLEETKDVRSECHAFDEHSNFALVLLVMSVVFLVFTSCMMLEQVEAITEGTSKIARLKMKVNSKGCTELQRVTSDFNEMFGGNSPNVSWHWFLPLEVQFPRGMRKVVLGYDFDETWGDGTAPWDEEEGMEPSSSSQHSANLSAGIPADADSLFPNSDEEPLDTVDLNNDSSSSSSSLVASPKDEAHLGSRSGGAPDNKTKPNGVLKRRKEEGHSQPKFFNRTKSLT